MMKNIKLKLGDIIYPHKIEGDKHEVPKCNLLLINVRGSYSQIEGFYCDICKKAYVNNLKYLEKKFSGYRYDSMSSSKDSGSERIFNLNGKFITRLGSLNARSHDFIDILALVPVLTLDKKIENIQVPALFCKQCQRFYIFETEMEHLERSGKILCRVVTEDYWVSEKNEESQFNLKSESILHKMGYNVNSRDNLRDDERQKILSDIISNGVLTRGEVCSHIDYLIRRSEGRPMLSDAIRKWKRDRKFASNIDLDLQEVSATEIKIRRRHV